MTRRVPHPAISGCGFSSPISAPLRYLFSSLCFFTSLLLCVFSQILRQRFPIVDPPPFRQMFRLPLRKPGVIKLDLRLRPLLHQHNLCDRIRSRVPTPRPPHPPDPLVRTQPLLAPLNISPERVNGAPRLPVEA